MAEFDNTNRGTLGKNKRKEKDTHPDYAGSINVNGVNYWLSGYLKEGPDGKFFSLSVRPKQDTPRQSSEPTRKAKADDFDQDVPF